MIYNVISYNQEQYILEALESIKLQVIAHGGAGENHLRVYDDASKDKTSLIAEAWLEKNRALFTDVRVSVNSENKGLVRNGSQAIRDSIGDRMKVIAADDLVGPSDIYAPFPDDGVLFSPCVRFNDQGVHGTNLYYFLQMHSAAERGELESYIASALSMCNIFEAPGSFISDELYGEPGLLSALLEWDYTDDVPIWRYLFFDRAEPPRVDISLTPLMMYRVEAGVSTSEKNAHSGAYQAERKLLCERFFPELVKPFYKRGPSFYSDFIKKNYLSKLLPVFSAEKRALVGEYEEGVRAAERHLVEVKQNAAMSANELGLVVASKYDDGHA